MGDALVDGLSDAGSTPARSTFCGKEESHKLGGYLITKQTPARKVRMVMRLLYLKYLDMVLCRQCSRKAALFASGRIFPSASGYCLTTPSVSVAFPFHIEYPAA